MKKTLLLILFLLSAPAAFPSPAPAGTGRVDAVEFAAVFQNLNNASEPAMADLRRLALRTAAGTFGEDAHPAVEDIRENFAKAALLCANMQDLLTAYAFIDRGFSHINPYYWRRVNRIRILLFQYMTNAEKALERLRSEKAHDFLPLLEKTVARIRTQYDETLLVEERFAKAGPPAEKPQP